MHRPIFGSPHDKPWEVYRITSTPALFLTDSTQLSDFYTYPIEFGRYRAISLQPGSLTDAITALDFMKMKIIILDLRNKVVEKRLIITKPGCGDGKYDSSLGTEACDDGNFINGDGCDQNCIVEANWKCTNVEGQKSVCLYVACGNGVIDTGEECDDGNYVDGDGCTSCAIDLGYTCARTGATAATPDTCTHMCGDGKVFK